MKVFLFLVTMLSGVSFVASNTLTFVLVHEGGCDTDDDFAINRFVRPSISNALKYISFHARYSRHQILD